MNNFCIYRPTQPDIMVFDSLVQFFNSEMLDVIIFNRLSNESLDANVDHLTQPEGIHRHTRHGIHAYPACPFFITKKTIQNIKRT